MPVEPAILFFDEGGNPLDYGFMRMFWDSEKVGKFAEEHPMPPNPYFESIDELEEEVETSDACISFNPDYISREFVMWFVSLLKLLKGEIEWNR